MNKLLFQAVRSIVNLLVAVSLIIVSFLFIDTPPTYAQSTDTSDVTWSIEVDQAISPNSLRSAGNTDAVITQVQSMLDTSLSGMGVNYEVVPLRQGTDGFAYTVKVNGNGPFEQIRNVLYQGLPAAYSPLSGVTELAIHSGVGADQEVQLAVESNPSTGMVWAISADAPGFVKSTKPDYEMRGRGRGMPERETLHLKAVDDEAELKLVYRRPWEQDAPTTRRISIQAGALPAEIDLSNPAPKVSPIPLEAIQPEPETPETQEQNGLRGLPTSYDSRTQGWNPSIKDQGYCGSCWAFGTVGAMEITMRKNGYTDRISEQFLISCNKDGWDCGGGFTATKYFYTTIARNQSAAGAVLQSAMPYGDYNNENEASRVSCTSKSHSYQLNSWAFLTGREDTVPSVMQIKQAIYDYGSVTAGVCAGDNMSYWGSSDGIYTSADQDDNCDGSTNHQIVLVGWNDSGGYWIMRNSWGTSWGESGFMRIKWGVGRVGEGASFDSMADDTKTAWPTNLLPASGTYVRTGVSKFKLRWSPPLGKTSRNISSYQVQVATDSAYTNIIYDRVVKKGAFTATGLLPDTTYYWRVRAVIKYSGVTGPWSSENGATSFTTVKTKPPVQRAPKNNALQKKATFKLTWKRPAGCPAGTATTYALEYSPSSDFSSDVTSISGLTGSSYTITTLPVNAPPMSYWWRVKAQNADGSKDYSDWQAVPKSFRR